LLRINYRAYNCRPYRYVFGTGNQLPRNFMDQLVKVDVRERTATTWGEPGRYPGEPVFVAAPEAQDEDEGGILSVVLDAHQGASFLLVLDASSFAELARTEVPHHIPFGLHGQCVVCWGRRAFRHLRTVAHCLLREHHRKALVFPIGLARYLHREQHVFV
jgi:carotenoid cleavage dioxygenase-like enzyme